MIVAFISLITDPSSNSSVMSFIDDFEFLQGRDWKSVTIFLAAALLVTFVLKNIFLLIFNFIQFRFLAINEAILSERLFTAYLKSSYALHLNRNSAEFIRTVQSCVSAVFNSVMVGLITLVTEAVMVIVIGAILFAAQPELTLAAVIVLGLSSGVYYVSIKGQLRKWGETEQQQRNNIIRSLQQGLHSLKETKVLGRADVIIGRFRELVQANGRVKFYTKTAAVAPRFWVESVMIVLVMSVVIFVLSMGGGANEILPMLSLFAAATLRLVPSTTRILYALSVLKNAYPAFNLVFDDLQTFRPEILDQETGQQSLTLNHSITLDNVGYSYPSADTPALSNIQLKINAGESIGLVGPSGSGKTTLVDIILGLLHPTEGSVRVDNKDVMESLGEWRSMVGYVPQSVYIFDDTLRSNIAYGFGDDKIDHGHVEEALKLSQLSSIVADLPNGLDTKLGERGVRLSGGQRQRIGIARALYSNPQVLIFDEATSSLDNETESEIGAAIESLRSEKTMIIIAHRLSTVRKCDRLLFLRDGKIVADDTFERMSHENAEFSRLVELGKL